MKVINGINPHNPHDSMFRLLFGREDTVTEFVEHFLPASLTAGLNYSSIRHETTTYVDDVLGTTLSDVVWSMSHSHLPDGLKLTFLFEHKSWPDRHVSAQLLKYLSNIIQTQGTTDNPYQPVIPIVLYHGPQKWTPESLHELFNLQDEYIRSFVPSFNFIFKNISEMTAAEMNMVRSQYARLGLLSMARMISDTIPPDLEQALASLDLSLLEGGNQNFLNALVVYLCVIAKNNQLRQDVINMIPSPLKQVTMTAIEEFYNEGIEKGIAQGIEKGIAQGIEKGIAQGIQLKEIEDVLGLNENGIPISIIAKSLKITEDKVKSILAEHQK